ncbi:hypothetical protein PSE10B_52130 [Pseudomonas amygdali pv. eriobotryae]|uniref:Uncharacterized protein n=1 Tax=Pseudomonas amygdali pv. eriobotryae TaxID=129137 RepID=A0A9P3EFQ8_PSEA0|nr:hypothetical protein PSE10A_56210 [Pseudomonas amygdali pv. eriobotryae]GFZ68691.1 hypothetical protein PSE10B_52130 [Pseudomonas amygdali pv. eriobotryae]
MIQALTKLFQRGADAGKVKPVTWTVKPFVSAFFAGRQEIQFHERFDTELRLVQCQVPCVLAERRQKCLRTPMSNQLMNQLQRSTRRGCVDWDFSLFIKAHS